MYCILNILPQIWLITFASATVFYVHEPSFIEIQPPDESQKTDFGYTMGYLSKKNTLVIGAPHHHLNGKVFSRSLETIFDTKTAVSTEIEIDLDALAGNYSNELAPEQSFCLEGSITVASDYFLTCAPLWRTVRDTRDLKYKYGAYGACFAVTDEGTSRVTGVFEQLSGLDERDASMILRKIHGGAGWSTLIDEANNVTLISLAPFNSVSDIGHTSITPTDSVKLMNVYSDLNIYFKNLGKFVPGKFFNDNLVTYAFSFRKEDQRGVIGFVKKPNVPEGEWEVTNGDAIVLIEDSENGVMFGAALCASDLNIDGYSDLLVGAPAHGSNSSYNSGAVHIFLGGNKVEMKKTRRTILAKKSGGFFGKTIASQDLDGDSFLEIFVSAPFEDGGIGAVYIFCGKEIYQFVKNDKSTTISVTDLKNTQRIQNSKFKSLGYSLQPLPDLDDNGCRELAMGAPNSGKVLVYRGMPSMLVQLSAKIDRVYVRQSDKNCSIQVKLNITYPAKPETISQKLKVTMKLVGVGVAFDGAENFVQNLSRDRSTYEKDIIVQFTDEDPGTYKFQAVVALDSIEYLQNDVFDESWIGISPYSTTMAEVPIYRRCLDDDCKPILTAVIQWSAGETYELGSSKNESVTVTVHNTGYKTVDSCVKILIEGSKVIYIKAEQDSEGYYTHWLPKPFERHATDAITIPLDMGNQSSIDKRLLVRVYLYDICHQENFTSKKKIIPYTLSTRDVFVDGFFNARNITDIEVSDGNNIITDDHVYSVVNKGTVTWDSVYAKIIIEKKHLIKSYHLSQLKMVDCTEEAGNGTLSHSCHFTLQRQQTVKFVITLVIDRMAFKDSLENGMLNTTLKFELYLQSNEDKIVNQTTTTFYYKKDTTWEQNKMVMIGGGVLLAGLVLLLITFILKKRGFFENEEKKKLRKLKHEVLKQSIKRPNPEDWVKIPNTAQENIDGQVAAPSQETNKGQESGEELTTNEVPETKK